MMADGRMDVIPLISHRFRLDQAEAAYAVVGGREPSLGILLQYSTAAETSDASVRESRVALPSHPIAASGGAPSVAFVGSGHYATAVLIPAFKAGGARMVSVASSAGISGVHAAKKYGFSEATTDSAAAFVDDAVDAVVIATRHDSHARFVVEALDAGKQSSRSHVPDAPGTRTDRDGVGSHGGARRRR